MPIHTLLNTVHDRSVCFLIPLWRLVVNFLVVSVSPKVCFLLVSRWLKKLNGLNCRHFLVRFSSLGCLMPLPVWDA